MAFSENLKQLRAKANLSQERLAEKLGVSRQAVTKWECGTGTPDLENVAAVAALFSVSIDELLNGTSSSPGSSLYESITEYDIAEVKRFDIKCGAANNVTVTGCSSEKLRICLTSNTWKELQHDFKVKIDDIRGRIDVDINRTKDITLEDAKNNIDILIELPSKYIGKLEIEATAAGVSLNTIDCEIIELGIKATRLMLNGIVGSVEVDCNLDMDIKCQDFSGALSINQVSSSSRLHLASDICFTAICKGLHTNIIYEENGCRVDSFSVPDSENIIEYNGIKSELIIWR